MNSVLLVMFIPFTIVCITMVYFVIKYRRRSDDDQTSSIDHNTALELTWTIIPTIILLFFFYQGITLFKKMRTPPPGSMEINVEGSQWNWSFFYPPELTENKSSNNQLKSNVLYLEENRDTKLIMKTHDVLHSFYVPAFRVKEDLVGGLFTFVYFNPLITKEQRSLPFSERKSDDPCYILHKTNSEKPQEERMHLQACASYRIFCAEYCGKDHSAMLNWAVVLPKNNFQKLLNTLSQTETVVSAERGEAIYKRVCAACHSTDGTKRVGPSFKNLWGKTTELSNGPKAFVDENYIQESILFPNNKVVKDFPAIMPPQNLSDAEIGSIIQFIKTLK